MSLYEMKCDGMKVSRISSFLALEIYVSIFLCFSFDYGEKFWIIKWKQFTCECGSPKCKYSKDTIQSTIADYNRRQQEEEALENA